MMTFDTCPHCGADLEGCTCPATLPFQGVGGGLQAPQTPTPYPSEGAPIIGAQNGVPPWPHSRQGSLVHERDGLYAPGWFALAHTQPLAFRAGRDLELGWWFAHPPNVGAFTTDAAGRLVLVTP